MAGLALSGRSPSSPQISRPLHRSYLIDSGSAEPGWPYAAYGVPSALVSVLTPVSRTPTNSPVSRLKSSRPV
nr:hypothetical protein [Nonomuraea jabiensis]